MSATHHNDAVPQLTVDTLVVELLKDLLKVAWKIHCPVMTQKKGEISGYKKWKEMLTEENV